MTTYLTLTGARRLEAELGRLKREERPAIIQAISDARAQGDLSENAEYDAARERQGMVEARIRDIEASLSNSQVIDPASLGQPEQVVFGFWVEVEDLDTALRSSYRLVGEAEADISQRWLSISAPLARALLGKKMGDVVQFVAPNGTRELEIIRISLDEAA